MAPQNEASNNEFDNNLLLWFMTEYRGIVNLLVVLPLSFLLETYNVYRDWFYRVFNAAPLLHDERVKAVQAQVRAWDASGLRGKKFMCTARKEWLTMSTRTATFKKDCNRISCNELKDILDIDTDKRIIRTEPLVNMRYMTAHLVPLGFQLAIQVEMEDLTIGGLCLGLGMETNSHLLGLIQETIVAFEIVLSDGSLVRATRDNEYSDLFAAIPWSHGTLGFLVAVELTIIPIQPYMHVIYRPTHSKRELCEQMKELSESPNAPSYLEATIYSREQAVIFICEPSDVKTPAQRKLVNRANAWWKPWFYIHAAKALETGEFEEYLPARDFFHRFTRSIFWELRDLIPFGNHPLYRHTLGWLGAPKVSFLKLCMTPQIRRDVVYKHVVQDIIIPIDEMSRGIDLFHEMFEIYPLLVFPIAVYDNTKDGSDETEPKDLPLGAPKPQLPTSQGFMQVPPKPQKLHGKIGQMYFDLGAYGVPQLVRDKKTWNARECIRAMEEFTRHVKGYQCLYADTFMSRDEFRDMFDLTHYDAMRKKYHAEDAFPEVYHKIRPEEGVLKVRNEFKGEKERTWQEFLENPDPKPADYKKYLW